jgi:hypothetical protein
MRNERIVNLEQRKTDAAGYTEPDIESAFTDAQTVQLCQVLMSTSQINA